MPQRDAERVWEREREEEYTRSRRARHVLLHFSSPPATAKRTMWEASAAAHVTCVLQEGAKRRESEGKNNKGGCGLSRFIAREFMAPRGFDIERTFLLCSGLPGVLFRTVYIPNARYLRNIYIKFDCEPRKDSQEYLASMSQYRSQNWVSIVLKKEKEIEKIVNPTTWRNLGERRAAAARARLSSRVETAFVKSFSRITKVGFI